MMGRPRIRVAAAALAVSAGLMIAWAGAADAAFPGRNGRIAFADYVSGQIYAVNPDGSGLDKLTDTGPHHAADSPRWSANGRRVVFDKFNSNTGGSVRLWVMNANGSHQRRLSKTPKRFDDQTPALTPNGRRIIFSRCLGETCAIWKMRADGTHQRALTPFQPVQETFDTGPVVSPNGGRIVFTRFNTGGINARLFLMRLDGTHLRRVTAPRFEGGNADWKPNGHRIVFNNNAFRPGSSVFTIRPNGHGIHRLTPSRYPFDDAVPAFSPRGNRIAFISDRNYPDECCNDLFEMGANGAGEQPIDVGLTNAGIIQPSWGTHRLTP